MNSFRHAPVLLVALLVAVPAGAGFAASAATAAAAPAKATKPAAHAVVPFIADDLDRALAEAKQRELPLFIESWAPW